MVPQKKNLAKKTAALYQRKNFFSTQVPLKREKSPENNSAEVALLMADTYLKLKNYKKAELFYQQALQQKPQNSEVLYKFGKLLLLTSRSIEAEVYLRKAVDIDSTNPRLICLLAKVLNNNGKTKEAIQMYNKAIELDDSLWSPHYGLYKIFHSAGMKKEARKALFNTIRKKPLSPLPYFVMGRFLLNHSKFESAERFFQHALILGYCQHTVHYYLGLCWSRREKEDPLNYFYAAQYFEKAIQLQPHNPLNHAALAFCCHKLEDYQSAILAYNEAIRLAPKHEKFYNALSTLYICLHRYKEAANVLENLSRVKTNDADLHYKIGCLLFSHGDLQSAIAHLSKAISINPEHTKAIKKLKKITMRMQLANTTKEASEQ
ncbi:MAG: tetratricopeptide repeat protein [Candidatus Anstonellales archaeon]